MRRLFGSAMQNDPQQAVSLLEGLPASARNDAVEVIAKAWKPEDFTAAWSWATNLPDLREKNLALSNLGLAAQGLDAARTFELADQITSEAGRLEFLDKCFWETHNTDPQKLTDVLRKLDPADARHILNNEQIMADVVRQDPARAARVLLDLQLPATDSLWAHVFEAWSGSEPGAARAWVAALPAAQQAPYLAGFIQKMVTTDAPGALAMALALPDEGQRLKLTCEVLSRWGNSDPAGFARAAEGMSGPTRGLALETIMTRKIQADPAAAAVEMLRLRASGLPEEVSVSELSYQLYNIGCQWVSRDPAQATAWISRLPTEEMQLEYVRVLTTTWVEEDSLSASRWVATLPPGAARNQAVSGLARAIQRADPQAAPAWAAQIPDAANRANVSDEILLTYIEKDLAAAKQSAANAPIPQERKRVLVKRADTKLNSRAKSDGELSNERLLVYSL